MKMHRSAAMHRTRKIRSMMRRIWEPCDCAEEEVLGCVDGLDCAVGEVGVDVG